jgi:hypothetical protein
MPEARPNPWQFSEQEMGPVIRDRGGALEFESAPSALRGRYSANTASALTTISYLRGVPSPFLRVFEDEFETPPARESEMAGPTREEFDAKLATVEAHTETRFTELSGKIDRLSDAISAFASNVKAELADTRATVRDENVFTRWTVVIAVVTSLIGAISALWVTQGNLLSAFTAGLTLRTETKEAPPSSTSAPPSQGQPKSR